ncbi:hypothetical protein M758_6G103500 [Ceratodon purpureus]|nr:hypothetical protein M758_6G103500 [Ceratodon purpureus]
MMQIFVPKGDGGTLAVRVSAEESVGALKRRVRDLDHGDVYLSFAGRPLADDARLGDCGVGSFCSLGFGVRVCGGGGDGGATGAESRDCYLNMYAEKKPDKVDPNEIKLAKFTNCAMTSEPLKPPCVIDFLGNIYNKEAVVHALLTKSMPKRLGYIKGLKDLIPVHFTSIPGVDSNGENSGSKFQCPVTGLEVNGKFKFVALRKCGHVLSARALKEVSSASCAVCYAPFAEVDKIPLNGSEEEVSILRERMEAEKAMIQEKKHKKVKNGKVDRTEKIAGDVAKVQAEEGRKLEKSSLQTGKRKGESSPDLEVAEVATVVRPKGSDLVSVTKKYKASDKLPENATKAVYASIFTSSSKGTFKETYSCRSLPLGRN